MCMNETLFSIFLGSTLCIFTLIPGSLLLVYFCLWMILRMKEVINDIKKGND